ncbi:MAG: hypothetical protein ACRECH_14370 [Nitrososphaerales archaeon]
MQCVDDGLLILGEDGKKVVLWWWETKRNLRRKDLPSHIEEFVSLLEEIFGSGAKIIESHIAKEVQRVFHLSEDSMLDLPRAIKMARKESKTQ